MYNSNTDLLGLILDVEVFFSLGHCSGALCFTKQHLPSSTPAQVQVPAVRSHMCWCDDIVLLTFTAAMSWL